LCGFIFLPVFLLFVRLAVIAGLVGAVPGFNLGYTCKPHTFLQFLHLCYVIRTFHTLKSHNHMSDLLQICSDFSLFPFHSSCWFLHLLLIVTSFQPEIRLHICSNSMTVATFRTGMFNFVFLGGSHLYIINMQSYVLNSIAKVELSAMLFKMNDSTLM
jgi:hypothetical protein